MSGSIKYGGIFFISGYRRNAYLLMIHFDTWSQISDSKAKIVRSVRYSPTSLLEEQNNTVQSWQQTTLLFSANIGLLFVCANTSNRPDIRRFSETRTSENASDCVADVCAIAQGIRRGKRSSIFRDTKPSKRNIRWGSLDVGSAHNTYIICTVFKQVLTYLYIYALIWVRTQDSSAWAVGNNTLCRYHLP
jgi:hypothetical protein